jgi:hypothetical protein
MAAEQAVYFGANYGGMPTSLPIFFCVFSTTSIQEKKQF